jgi:hypothetical protein
LNLRDVPDDLAHALRVEAVQAAMGIKDYCVVIFESRKKIADDSAWVVGENPACAPMGKREYGDYFPVIDTTPVEDKGKVLDELRGMVANMENNVLISPVMGADGNFADACSACWGKGTVAGCAECGVILDGDQDENNLPRCSHVEYCEDGESYGCSREFGHKGKCVRGRRVEV